LDAQFGDKLAIANLKSKFHRRVSPGERDLTSSNGDPGTNGVISKTRCEVGIKTKSAILQGAFWPLIKRHVESH